MLLNVHVLPGPLAPELIKFWADDAQRQAITDKVINFNQRNYTATYPTKVEGPHVIPLIKGCHLRDQELYVPKFPCNAVARLKRKEISLSLQSIEGTGSVKFK